MASETVRETRQIAAPPVQVFAVLADPAQHAAIDGTGWVSEAIDTAPLTGTGQTFRMKMYHENHPDKDYEMTNEVVVFDVAQAISWRPGQPADDGHLRFGGWIWRYDLVESGDGSSEVTLSYDWSAVPPRLREVIQFPPFGPDHLRNSLAHLAELSEESST